MGGARASFQEKALPIQSGRVSGWLRLAASDQSGGEWTPSIVDVLNAGSPMVQTDVDRRAAVGSSANGLPTMVFDGSDVHLWPQSPAISATTKQGIWLWYKPGTAVGQQMLLTCASNGSLGSDNRRLTLFGLNAALNVEAYITDTAGRSFSMASVLAAGVWIAIYVQYDSSRGGDANMAVYLNGVLQSPTVSDIGVGGTLTTLQAASGSATVGANNDSDTPVVPIANGGQIGPNIFAFNDNLSLDEIAALMKFERPT